VSRRAAHGRVADNASAGWYERADAAGIQGPDKWKCAAQRPDDGRKYRTSHTAATDQKMSESRLKRGDAHEFSFNLQRSPAN
jgi:hypothetical protein